MKDGNIMKKILGSLVAVTFVVTGTAFAHVHPKSAARPMALPMPAPVVNPTLRPNRLITFNDLHVLVADGRLSWEHCKPGPSGKKIVSGADFQKYIQHGDMRNFPAGMMVSYSDALKYAATKQKC